MDTMCCPSLTCLLASIGALHDVSKERRFIVTIGTGKCAYQFNCGSRFPAFQGKNYHSQYLQHDSIDRAKMLLSH